MLLNIEHVTKSYGDRKLLDDVTLYLKSGDRVGIVGVNGCGKTTLLKLASMNEEPDEGKVSTDPNIRIAYLSQNLQDKAENTVIEQVFAGIDPTARAIAEYEAVEILNRLGISDVQQKIGELSGGQRKRVALAACLVHPADLLILDEPTNHLDTEMIVWLEEYLNAFNGAIFLVTHDRYFLEHVANRTLEVAFGKTYMYEGGYSAYLDGKARREEMQAASERKRQSILRRELIWVLQGPCARGTKSRERLERYEALKAKLPPEYQQDMEEIRAVSSRLGKTTIEFKNVGKSYNDKKIIDNFSYIVLRDDRVGIVGRNGTGKSTLLNIMSGRIQPDKGTLTIGETVKIGYFSQHASEMDETMTAIEYVKSFGEKIETADGYLTASKLMEKFLFKGPSQHRKIDKLSGGEKRRLFLLGILAAAPNVLLLDEPTNDLDIPTLEILEDYLSTFPGAIVAVSHDRYFLDRVCSRVFAFDGSGRIHMFNGGYTDYRELEIKETKTKSTQNEKKETVQAVRDHTKKLKFSFKEQREFETIDNDIAALETKIAENTAEQEKYSTDYVKLQELMTVHGELAKQLEEKMDRWVYLNDLAERIAAQ